MAIWLYNLITAGYFATIRLASFFSGKARLWVTGRKNIFERLASDLSKRNPACPLLWMHCASLGEFEQGRPVLEALRREYPELQMLLTFFSPSGYEIRKTYPGADWVYYLPADSASNARKFLDIVQPTQVIFVKYEFWYHFLSALRQRSSSVFLVAAIFREKHPFFQWYGSLHRNMLACFNLIFVQDKSSLDLVSSVTQTPLLLTGDTRVDRVALIAQQDVNLPFIELFCGNNPVLVCGSTWPEDERLISHFAGLPAYRKWKVILAPHDIKSTRIRAIERKFPGITVRYSTVGELAKPGDSLPRILVIDNIGMLAKLYRFGRVAYIGGGFGKGIHNTLEAIACRIPVIFGPNYEKFAEAVWLVEQEGGFTVKNEAEMEAVLEKLQSGHFYLKSGETAISYIRQNQGATRKIINAMFIEANHSKRSDAGPF